MAQVWFSHIVYPINIYMFFKKIYFLFITLSAHLYVLAQHLPTTFLNKPIIDSTAIKHWITLGYGNQGQLISNDGRFFCYLMQNRPVGSQTTVLQSLEDSSTLEFLGATPLFFTANSKELVLTSGDTLIRYKIVSGQKTTTAGVQNVKYASVPSGEWVAFQQGDGYLSVLNCLNNKVISISGATDYTFDNIDRRLLIKTVDNQMPDTIVALKILDLATNTVRKLWSGTERDNKLSGYSFSPDGKSVCFLIRRGCDRNSKNEIWIYNERMHRAEKKADNYSPGIAAELGIADIPPKFSPNGQFIFFYLRNNHTSSRKKDYVSVDVWNYRDPVIQSTQLLSPGPRLYTAAIGMHNNNVVQLESDSTALKTYPDMTRGDYAITMTDVGDQFWLDPYSKSNFVRYFLVSMIDGRQRELTLKGNNEFYFSPSGKYLIYFNSSGGNSYYYSYDIATNKSMNICKNTSPTQFGEIDHLFEYGSSPDEVRAPVGIAGWLAEDKGVLVYDKNDIWILDYVTGRAPRCLTKGYGKENDIKFWLLDAKNATGYEITPGKAKYFLLAAFNTRNCYNGFYRISFDANEEPEMLSMGPWTVFVDNAYFLPRNLICYDGGIEPLKAKSSDIWIVKRHTATDAPNYFYTKNFKDFIRITNVQPHAKYNWLQSERVEFPQLDNIKSNGILYKPEDFDPSKRYPVIIHYYQHLSERVYQYLPARFASSIIDIPWFVSRGYLVFTPDIHFTKGKLGLSAYNAVMGAADWLSKQPFVNPDKIGINGHSLGGFKTDYLVTHTSRFAAALSGAGVSNMIEGTFSLGGFDNGSRIGVVERRLGSPFYGNIDLYLENSPILKADKVTTPLLLFHCKADYAVSWQHSVELFSALRRLQKPVWLLQYDDGNHDLDLEKDKIDYTIRITQFFDHYLKDHPMPRWMSAGIPAYLKGIESGYEHDGLSQ